ALRGDHLAGRYGARVIITGGPGDGAEAEAVADASYHRPAVLAGRTSFGVLAALLERCRFAVGTDNGAMHLATARGVPTLRLFGPVDPLTWGGWAGPSIDAVVAPALACAPCHRLDLPPWEVASHSAEVAYPCMRDVSVEQVIAVVERLWSSTADRRT
ncbi:MAG: glycosyltransferase family 9 protein, partial [Chloroflexota bacterium]|nr:glycosyltransferase family 9 protein [Chloroflexota bacterium]